MPDNDVAFLNLGAATAEVREPLAAALGRVLDSGWYVGGEELRSFEAAWAAFCGTAYAVGASNGMDALTLALRAGGIGPGDEVIVPAWTFVATWLAVSAAGATPVPVEVCPATSNLEAAAVADAVTPRTRAVVPVHLYGRLSPVAAVREAVGPDVLVVEDAAQAHGARAGAVAAGALGDAAAFSFYPSKNLGALGDAGAVTSQDPDLAQTVRQLGSYGSRKKYGHELAGRNARLDPIQAAALAVKLPLLESWNARRHLVAQRYREALGALEWLELPPPAGQESVWHLYVVRTVRRDALRAHLTARGVQTGLHYPVPPHRTGAYAARGLRLPGADALASTSLSLPIGPHLAPGDVERVAAAVHDFPA